MPADGPFEFTRADFREVLSRVRPIAYYELPKSLGPAFRRGAPLIRVAADGSMSAAICESPLSGVYLAIVPTSVHVDRLGVSIHMEAGELINVGAVEPIWVKEEPQRRSRAARAQTGAAGVDWTPTAEVACDYPEYYACCNCVSTTGATCRCVMRTVNRTCTSGGQGAKSASITCQQQ